jgi:hypothetical protein
VGNLTLRPKWYSAASWPALCGVVLFCVVAPIVKNNGLFGVSGVLVVAWVISMYGTTIQVTPTDVGVRLWFLGRRAIQRDAIRAMHWYGGSFTFVHLHTEVLLQVQSFGWMGSQMLELSEALGVPLYNHRTKGGFGRDAMNGQLMQRATKGEPGVV